MARSVALTFLTALCACGRATADDLDTVRQRMLAAYGWPSPLTPESVGNVSAAAVVFASKLFPNGTWPDVNYNDGQDRTLWATSSHMNRIASMAAALSIPSSPRYADPWLFNQTRLALNAWYTNDWQNVNWWWDIIFCPQSQSLSFLMLDMVPKGPWQVPPFPTPAELAKGSEISLRATWWNASLGYEVTGANLAWMVQAQLLRGAWPSAVNMSAVQGGFDRLWQEAKVVDWDPACTNGTNQGVQVDGAYHMHGPQLQTAAYGQDYTGDMLAFLSVAAGTQWDIPAAGTAMLCSWMADGFAWTSTGMGVDWAASGRQVSRNSWSAESKVIINTTLLRGLAARCDASYYQPAVLALADRIDDKAGAAQLTGNKAMWTSDYAVHRREGWTAAWHGHSTRTGVNECGNGENLAGMYEAQGVLNIYSTTCEVGPNASSASGYGPVGWGCGMEYATVFPLLDWNQINGATAFMDDPVPPCPGPAPAPQCCWTKYVSPTTARPFVGSVSDGLYGASAFDSSFLSLTARKGYLFFDRAVLAVGANVTDTAGVSGRIGTALASRYFKQGSPGVALGWANGTTATLASANTTFPAGGAGSDALSWAYADGLGWLTAFGPDPLTGSTAYPSSLLWAGYRKEEWSSIGPFPGSQQGNTLSLSILHAPNTTVGRVDNATFAYLVVPGLQQAGDMAAVAADPLHSWVQLDPSSLANNHSLQAAAQVNATDLVILALFWHPGTYSYSPPGALSSWQVVLTVDQPVLLSYREHRPGAGVASTVTLAASNPDAADLSVTVAVSSGTRSGCGPLTFALNPSSQPNYLGQSAVQGCSMA